MKILCSRDELLKALQVVTRAIPSTTAIPELTHVLLESENKSLKLSATNMKTFISTKLDAQIEQSGEILLQGQFFLELITSLKDYPETNVVLSVNPDNHRTQLTLDGEALKYELPGRGREDYPNIALIDADLEVKLSGKEFKELLKIGSICSAATENSIQGYRGICVDLSKDRFTVASMDGNRLVRVSRNIPVDINEPRRWLIGMDVVSELLRVLPDEEISLKQNGNKFLLEFDRSVFQSLLSDSEFVDYEDYIPEDLEGGAVVSAVQLAGHLRGLQPVARESGNRIVLEQQSDRLGISSFSEKFGEGYRELIVNNPEAGLEQMTVAFNSKFLLDYLGAFGDEELHLVLEGEGMPAYFWPKSNSEGFEHVCVIMSLSMH